MEALLNALKTLRLSGIARTLPMRLQEAKANELDYRDFLDRLVTDELQCRKDNLLNRRLKAAQLPALKTLDEFDFAFNPGISKKLLNELASVRFVHQAHNILFIGPPGIGKTHLSIALAIAAIHAGYPVFYRSAFDLVQDMADAARNDTRKKLVSQYVQYRLLVVDEFGMKKMPPNAADDFLEIIHRRYGHTATIIATNRPIEDWSVILGDTAAASAILDRFLDNAEIISLKGAKSFRMGRKTNKE